MTGQEALILAMLLAAASIPLMITALMGAFRTNKRLSIIYGPATSLCAGVSMYCLHIALVNSGKSSSPLGAVFGTWGLQRALIPSCYTIAVLGGFLLAVFGILRTKK